jgi:hypothetical protein
VGVVWDDDTLDTNIPFKGSSNGRKTFGKTKSLTDNDDAISPEIAASGNNMYVVWSEPAELRNGVLVTDIFFRRGVS